MKSNFPPDMVSQTDYLPASAEPSHQKQTETVPADDSSHNPNRFVYSARMPAHPTIAEYQKSQVINSGGLRDAMGGASNARIDLLAVIPAHLREGIFSAMREEADRQRKTGEPKDCESAVNRWRTRVGDLNRLAFLEGKATLGMEEAERFYKNTPFSSLQMNHNFTPGAIRSSLVIPGGLVPDSKP